MTSGSRTMADCSTAPEVVGSLGVLGTAAAVAGMGTFGTFTDSTTPVATTIQSGALSIDPSQQGYAVPVATAGFLPGDSMTRAVHHVNDGNSPLGTVTLSSTATAGSVLTTDTTNGLQLTAKKCSAAWKQGGTASARHLQLRGGGIDYRTFSISLPASADNIFQGRSASLSLVFTGIQRAGSARCSRPDNHTVNPS